MQRNRNHRGSSSRDGSRGNIPSLLDMSSSGGSSRGTGGRGFGSTTGLSYGSSSFSGGLIGGMSAAEALSKPMSYFSNLGASSHTSNGSGGCYSNNNNNAPGLLGDGMLGRSSTSSMPRYSSGSTNQGYGGSSGGGRSGLLSSGGASSGGDLDDFAAKVRLQQQMLADERQKSVQEQIQEQLEKQNRKRLEYNRMKRDRDTHRRGGGGDKTRDNRPRSAGGKDMPQETGLDDVHVTIKARSEGRAVSDNTGGRKRNLSDRSRNQHTGPQNAKRSPAQDNSDSKSGLTGPFKCHVCIVTCRDMKGYELHMKGRKHKEVMDRMKQATEYQAKQAIQRLEAEKHLKKMQGHNKEDEDHYCRDCLAHYTGDMLAHRRTKEHKDNRRTQRPHCRVCDVSFKTVKKYVAHCNTPGHKKVYEAAKIKGDKADDDYVTVDSVGQFDEGDNEALMAANLSPEGKVQQQETMQTDLGDGFNQAIKVTNVPSEEDDDVVIDSDADMDGTPREMSTSGLPLVSDSGVFPASSASADDSTIDDLVSAQLVSEPESMITTMADYDSDVAIGRHLVVPVWGYFCRPCRKFYQSVGSQGAVLDAHCKTREHYDAYRFVQSQSGGAVDADEGKDMDYLSLGIAQHQENADSK